VDCTTDKSETQPSEKQKPSVERQVVDVVLVASVQGESVVAGEEHDDLCSRLIQAVLDHKAKHPFTTIQLFPVWNDDMDDPTKIEL